MTKLICNDGIVPGYKHTAPVLNGVLRAGPGPRHEAQFDADRWWNTDAKRLRRIAFTYHGNDTGFSNRNAAKRERRARRAA